MSETVATQVEAIAFDRDIERLTEGFTGRKWVFEEIDRWLQKDNERFFILTGEPGVGKSAIAARLTQLRQDIAAYHFCIAGRSGTVEPNNVLLSLAAQLIKYFSDYGEALVNTVKPLFLQVNVEINIENIRDSVVQGVVIENLHIHYPKQALDIVLRQALEALPNPPREPVSILIDSLDEAVTYSNKNNLVTLLSNVDDLPSWVRFIFTTRPERRVLRYFERLKPYPLAAKSQMNLDDIHQYIENRVGKEKMPARLQLAKVEPQNFVNCLTELSTGNFLYTKILLNDIEAGRQTLNDLSALPRSLDEIYHGFLKRFTVTEWEKRYQPILGVLAVAQEPITEVQLAHFTGIGQGKIRQYLGVVRQFLDISEDGHGRETFSVFHQSLRNYLLNGERNRDFWCETKEQHQKIFNYYWDNFHPNKWRGCDDYGLTYIATHSAAAERLDQVVNDLSFLVLTDPKHLLEVLDMVASGEAKKIAAVYRLVSYKLNSSEPSERAAYLELAARQQSANNLADRITQLPFRQSWSVLWAHWKPRPPYQVFGRDSSNISALEVATWESEQPVALVGRSDGSAEVWHITNGTLLNRWKPDGVKSVGHLALTETQGGWLLIVAWYSGHLGVFDLTSRREIKIRTLKGINNTVVTVTALCIANRGGRPVCVTAQRKRLAIWELPSLNLIEENNNATDSNIYCFHVIQHEPNDLLLSGNDSYIQSQERRGKDNSKLRLWSLEDLSSFHWEDAREESGVVQQIKSEVFNGRLLLTISQRSGPWEVWDWGTRKLVCRGNSPMGQTWLHEFEGDIFLLSLSVNENLSVYRITESSQKNELSLDYTLVNRIPTKGDTFTDIIKINNRAIFLSAISHHVRVWDLDNLIASDSSREESLEIILTDVRSLAAITTPSQQLYLGGSYGKIIAVDAATGEVRWDKQLPTNFPVKALAVSPEQNYLVAGDDGSIQIIDTANKNSSLYSIPAGSDIEKLCVLDNLAFATVRTNDRWEDRWEVRVWNLQTREEVASNCEYRLYMGEEDKRMYGLTVAKTSTSVRMAFASRYGKIMVADFENCRNGSEHSYTHRDYETWHIPNTREEYIDSLTSGWVSNELLLAAGTEYGHLSIWDFLSGELKASHSKAHIDGISVLRFHTLGTQEVLVSGGIDGILRFWTLELSELFTIEVNEAIRDLTWIENYLYIATDRGVLAFQFNT